MPENNNGKSWWNRYLVQILVGIMLSFAGLCITGFFCLLSQDTAQAQCSAINRERIAKLEECIAGMKEKVVDIDYNVKELIKLERRRGE